MKKLMTGAAISALTLGLLWGCQQAEQAAGDAATKTTEMVDTVVDAADAELTAMLESFDAETFDLDTINEDVAKSNPLLADWDTAFGIPTFDAFDEADYLPAIQYGIANLRAEIAAIENNPDAPTFENTIVALDQTGEDLSKVGLVFANITNTEANDTYRQLESIVWPMWSKESDAIYLSDTMWQRVKDVWEQRDSLDLNQQEARLLELTHRDFVRSGADLDPETKERMKAINARLSELTTKYGQNLTIETNSFKLILEEDELGGLSDDLVGIGKAAAEQYFADKDESADGKYAFGLSRAIYEGFMTSSTNREAREKLFHAYTHRGDNGNEQDNNDIILEIVRLRAEAARLRGYDSHAHFILETNMAKTPQGAIDFLLQVWEPGLAKAKVELSEMQALVGDDYTVEGHDWWHLSDQVRQAKYALDDNEIRPYFELNNVTQGAFDVAEKLFGLSITELEGVPVWNDVVTAYDVRDENGEHLGVFMMDMYARDSKRGGAWMSSYRSSDADTRPIITNNLNLPQPAEGEPTLMAFGQVNTLFHEFGHGLHGLMSQIDYGRFSGVSGPRDYTEFPAQMLEHWGEHPDVLAEYATHYETGEVIPQELLDKMKRASNYGQGFATTEYIAASLLDMRWHMLTLEEANAITDAAAFETQVLSEYGLLEEIKPRYRSTYFSHIFAGGYSAGYYAYLWSEILDADGFEAFKEVGDIYDPVLAQRLRENVYEAGGLEEADVLYRKFRGQDPSIDPLLENRGLAGGT